MSLYHNEWLVNKITELSDKQVIEIVQDLTEFEQGFMSERQRDIVDKLLGRVAFEVYQRLQAQKLHNDTSNN